MNAMALRLGRRIDGIGRTLKGRPARVALMVRFADALR